jgi:hypothetical protein
MKYAVSDDFSVAFRGELFSDRSSVNSVQYDFIPSGVAPNNYVLRKAKGMNIIGGTLSLEYSPSEIGYLRIETRYLYDTDSVLSAYPDDYQSDDFWIQPMLVSRTQVMATVGFYFDKTFTFAR